MPWVFIWGCGLMLNMGSQNTRTIVNKSLQHWESDMAKKKKNPRAWRPWIFVIPYHTITAAAQKGSVAFIRVSAHVCVCIYKEQDGKRE